MESLHESLEGSDVESDFLAVFLASAADTPEHAAVAEAELSGWNCVLHKLPSDPNYAAKINAGAQFYASIADWYFFGADDLRFHRGWWEKAMEHALPHVGVIGTNDLCNPRTMRGMHSTHHLVAPWYAALGALDGGGPLYEGYIHEFCDDEFVESAKKRGNWAHAVDSLVEHLHPMCGKCADPDAFEKDPHYGGMGNRIRYSRQLFLQRSVLWN